jgi:hypothetical protein
MRVRLLVSFAGVLAGVDCPIAGYVMDVDETLGVALCSNGRAERVDVPPVDPPRETAMAAPARERAVRPRGRAR